VETLAKNHPEDIFTLYHPSEFVTGAPVANVCSKMAFGVGIMLPKQLIKPVFENPIRPEDDMSVTFYAIARTLRILTPMPSIVQHLQLPSLIGSDPQESKSYVKTPKQNWKSKEIINI